VIGETEALGERPSERQDVPFSGSGSAADLTAEGQAQTLNRMSWLREWVLGWLQLADAAQQAQQAKEACILAQRAAAHALSYAQAARDAADSVAAGGPATRGRAGLDEDIDTSPYPR